MRLVAGPAELTEAVSSGPPRGRLRVRRRHRVPRAVRCRPPARRGADPRRHRGHRDPPVRARVLHPASLPEDRRGVPVTGRRCVSARRPGRRGRRRGPGGRLHRRRHRRVRAGPRWVLLLPGDEHPAAGGAPGHRGGHRPGPGGTATADRRRRATAAARPAARDSTATRSRSGCTPRTSLRDSSLPPARCTASPSRKHPASGWTPASRDGSVVGPHYDAMLAKVIAHGRTRADAARRLARALRASRDPRPGHQPRPARGDPARAGLPGRRHRHRLPDPPRSCRPRRVGD